MEEDKVDTKQPSLLFTVRWHVGMRFSKGAYEKTLSSPLTLPHTARYTFFCFSLMVSRWLRQMDRRRLTRSKEETRRWIPFLIARCVLWFPFFANPTNASTKVQSNPMYIWRKANAHTKPEQPSPRVAGLMSSCQSLLDSWTRRRRRRKLGNPRRTSREGRGRSFIWAEWEIGRQTYT